MDISLEAAKKIRAYEAEHPWQALAGGFTPGVGEISAAAALRDPDAPWWEKALNVPGLLPSVGGASKAIVLLASKLRKVNPEAFAKAAKFIDPLTGKKMAEISDHAADLNYDALYRHASKGEEVGLGDVLSHPELFKAESGLGDVGFEIGNLDPKSAGEYTLKSPGTSGTVAMRGNPGTVKDWMGTLLHETQHAADDTSGIMEGTSHLPERDYWFHPAEVRARVTAQRRKYTPEERIKYSFDTHMKDEIERLKDLEDSGFRLSE